MYCATLQCAAQQILGRCTNDLRGITLLYSALFFITVHFTVLQRIVLYHSALKNRGRCTNDLVGKGTDGCHDAPRSLNSTNWRLPQIRLTPNRQILLSHFLQILCCPLILCVSCKYILMTGRTTNMVDWQIFGKVSWNHEIVKSGNHEMLITAGVLLCYNVLLIKPLTAEKRWALRIYFDDVFKKPFWPKYHIYFGNNICKEIIYA